MASEEFGARHLAYRHLPRPQVPAALPHVHGSPVRRVVRRLRRPVPRGTAGDPAFPRRWTSRARRRCRVRLLASGHSRPPSTRKLRTTPSQSPYRAGPGARRAARGWLLTSLGAAVQAMRLSPYRAGLARHGPTRLPTTRALTACYSPLWLSPPGKPLTQRQSFRTSPFCKRDPAPDDAAHHRRKSAISFRIQPKCGPVAAVAS